MRIMKKSLFLSLTVALFCVLITHNAFAAEKPLTLKMGHTGPVNSSLDVGLKNIAKEVQEKTGGSVVIQIYPQGQLGSEEVMLDSAITGTLDIAITSTPILANIKPEFNALSLPFLFKDVVDFFDIVTAEKFIGATSDLMKGKNLVLLGYPNALMRGLSNTKRNIRTPADMKGLKIRVMAGPLYTDMFNAMGATTSTLPFSELYSALQQGVVDGEDNHIYVMNIMKFMEVEKYHTVLNHTVQCNAFLVNEKVWNKLSADQRQIFKNALNNLVKVYLDMVKSDTEKAIQAAEKNRVNVINLSSAEGQAFKNAVQPVYAKYRKAIGDEFYNYVMSQVESHKK